MSQATPSRPLPDGTHLVLLLLGAELAAWQVSATAPARALPVQGQMRLPVSSAQSLASAFRDVIERLHGDSIDPVAVHWLLDAGGRELSAAIAAPNADETTPPWQILAWEWLAARFGLPHDRLRQDDEHLVQDLLPWLVCSDTGQERQQRREALNREHQDETQRLAAERARLQRDNEQLHAQNQALQKVDSERLASFLPALFARVFTQLGPVDLALLCGNLEPLNIPNPYPEPSEETLRVLQKRFRDLPRPLQKQIVGFVAHLPQRQRLLARAEMRGLINELEES